MYQLEGGGDHHWDLRSRFLPPSIELTSSAILDCLVDIFIDTRPPESIRDKALHSLLALVPRIMMATIDGSPSVCPLLQSISLCPLGISVYICDTTVLHTRSAGLHFSTGFSLWECSCLGRGET